MKNNSVSIAKAFAILLMVAGHANFSHTGNEIISLFHMPIFFFFSGYCLKSQYLTDFNLFAKKRIKRIWLPYIKWGGVFLLMHNFFYMLGFYGPSDYNNSNEFSCMFGVEQMIKNVFCLCLRLTNHDQLLGGYWFLHTLFFASFISYALIKYVKENYLALLFAILISTSLYYFKIKLPFFYIGGLEFLASSFIILGYICRKSSYYKFCLGKIYLVFLLFVIIAYCAIKFWPCSMLTITWDKVFIYIVSAFISIMAIHSLCSVICTHQRKLTLCMSYVGNNTMSILTWHFLIFKLVSVLLVFVYCLPYDQVSSFPVIEMNNSYTWLLYFISGTFVPVVFSKYFKYFKTA